MWTEPPDRSQGEDRRPHGRRFLGGGPRLQRKLLAWLLGPLALLLVLDTGAAYWNSLRFSNLAYDRALHEIGREIGLHVKLDGGARS